MINFEFQREYTIIIDDFNSKNEEIKREERDFGEYIEKEVFEELRELNKKNNKTLS